MGTASSSCEQNRNLPHECKICLEIYRKPKLLFCGHSFCGECLDRTAGNARRVVCPICRKPTDIPSEGLKPNYALQDALDEERNLNKIRKNIATSFKEFNRKVSIICQGLNEKLEKWNEISEMLNAMASKSFEMAETAESMNAYDCEQWMKDIEKMTSIITDIASNFDQLNETRFLSILQQNQDNILIKNTNQLPSLAEELSTVSLEEEHIGTVTSSQLTEQINRDNVLINNTNQFPVFAEQFSTVSLDEEQVVAVASSQTTATEQINWHNELYTYFEALDEGFPTLSLEEIEAELEIGAMTSSQASATEQETMATRVLIVGGRNIDFNLLNSLEVYNPNNGANNRLLQSELHESRSAHVAAAFVNTSLLYVVGGFNKGALKSMEMFDLITHQWLGYGPEMGEERAHFACVAIQDQLMVFGGYGRGSNHLRSCESFNPFTQRWSPLPGMEKRRALHCAVEFDEKIYMIGGRGYEILSSVSIFNANTATWMSGPVMKQGRTAAAAAKIDSGIVVTGGFGGLNSCEMLDPRKKKWMTIAPMQQERHGHVLVNCEGRLLAMGGSDMNRKPCSSVEEYDPRAHQWRFVESLLTERTKFAAVTVPYC